MAPIPKAPEAGREGTTTWHLPPDCASSFCPRDGQCLSRCRNGHLREVQHVTSFFVGTRLWCWIWKDQDCLPSFIFSCRSFISLCFTFRSTDQADSIFVKTVGAVSIVTAFLFKNISFSVVVGEGARAYRVRGKLAGFSFFLPPWGENSEFRDWQQAPLLTEPSHQPEANVCMRLSSCSGITGCRGEVFSILWRLFFCWRPVDRICMGSASGLGGPFCLFLHQHHNADH